MRKIVLFLLIPLLSLLGVFFFYYPGAYIIKQIPPQLSLIFQQIPLEEVHLILKEKKLLNLLEETKSIVTFGTQKMGLKKTDNYTGYYHVEGKGITHVLTAAPEFEMKAHQWKYPIVGSLPFRGYFDKKDADEFEQKIIEEGFDIYRFAAPAYSTLGWFRDPITTPMLRSGRNFMISTVLHEMAHATYFIKNSGDLNEKLASFVGRQGMIEYLEHTGTDLEKYNRDKSENSEKRTKYRDIVLNYKNKLTDLYKINTLSNVEMRRRKKNLLNELSNQVKKLYPKGGRQFLTFNNARLLQFNRYRPDDPIFENIWKESGENWESFWQIVKRKFGE